MNQCYKLKRKEPSGLDQQLNEMEQLSDELLDPLSLSRLESEAVSEGEKLRLLKQQERQQKFFHNRQTIQTNALVKSSSIQRTIDGIFEPIVRRGEPRLLANRS